MLGRRKKPQMNDKDEPATLLISIYCTKFGFIMASLSRSLSLVALIAWFYLFQLSSLTKFWFPSNVKCQKFWVDSFVFLPNEVDGWSTRLGFYFFIFFFTIPLRHINGNEKPTAFISCIIISVLPTRLIILGNRHISTKPIDSSLFSATHLPNILFEVWRFHYKWCQIMLVCGTALYYSMCSNNLTGGGGHRTPITRQASTTIAERMTPF